MLCTVLISFPWLLLVYINIIYYNIITLPCNHSVLQQLYPHWWEQSTGDVVCHSLSWMVWHQLWGWCVEIALGCSFEPVLPIQTDKRHGRLNFWKISCFLWWIYLKEIRNCYSICPYIIFRNILQKWLPLIIVVSSQIIKVPYNGQ